MNGDALRRLLSETLDSRRDARQLRQRSALRPVDSTHVEIDGRKFVNFASNNYLGLTHHPRILSAAQQTLQTAGLGSGAAGLISGYTSVHASAEQAIARWKQTESAVLLPSGYQANLAAVQTLAAVGQRAGGGARFILDKLAHASLIDAVRATGLPWRAFPHNGLSKLKRLLLDAPPGQLQVVVTESIFSMDGDEADLPGLANLKRDHPFVLLLDEAHASGVFGAGGGGLAAECGLNAIVDVAVATFSKALGCVGAAVCASREFCDALVNEGRAYIYSTSIPASVAAAAEAAVAVVQDEPHRQRRVRELAARLRDELAGVFQIPPGRSPIVPIIVGSEEAALEASQRLRERGLLVPAVRPPSVPRGASRLRVTLCCDHTDDEVVRLTDSLRAIGAKEDGTG